MKRGLIVGALAAVASIAACESVVTLRDDGPPSTPEVEPPPGTSDGGGSVAAAVTSGSGPATSGAGGDATGAGGGANAEPIALATGLQQPTFIAIAGDYLYVTEHGYGPPDGALVRLPKAGGSFERVVPYQNGPWAITVADGYVFWSNYGSGDDGSIKRLSLADDSVDDLAPALAYPWSLAYHEGSLFYAESNAERVMAIRPDLSIDIIANDQVVPTPLAVDATGVYVGVQGGSPPSDSPIRRIAHDGTQQDIYTGVERSHVILLDAAHLYFATDDGVIRRGTRTGDPATVLASVGGIVFGGALADGYLYFTMISDGVVARVPTAGGDVEPLAVGSMPEGIAVDDQFIYWVNQASGEVMRRAK